MAKLKKKLSDNLATQIRHGVNTMGSYDPKQVMPYIEEQLTFDEINQAEMFLAWVYDNGKTFGWNIQDIYAEFVRAVS